MKERPILFSAPMVRALLDGSKTQTRRAAKLTGAGHVKEVGGHRRWHPADENCIAACPYGQPGDRLWVRETWIDASSSLHSCVIYRADGDDQVCGVPWKPSIFMPRAASRILLEVTAVRIERLHAISEDDALAEGVVKIRDACHVIKGFDYDLSGLCHTNAVTPYAKLWESINGPESWAQNPWVWVIEFKRVQPIPENCGSGHCSCIECIKDKP